MFKRPHELRQLLHKPLRSGCFHTRNWTYVPNVLASSTHLLSFSPLDGFIHVFLAANAEVLDRLCDTFQWAVDVLWVHVFCVIVKSTADTVKDVL